MKDRDVHLSDEELLLAADGELSPEHLGAVREHVASCWTCRIRAQELERAIGVSVRKHRARWDSSLPDPAGPRALLKAQLAAAAASAEPPLPGAAMWRAAVAAAVLVLCGFAILGGYRHRTANRAVYAPSPRLTPGVARAIDRRQLCQAPLPKNQVVPAAIRRRVFEVYGIANADPRAYEVDYLITPALGGTDDIRNLWPQSYVSTVWNARVKDALEDRLRDLVCRGDLNLADAQRDISTDWIGAYKKYFGTTEPR